MATSIKMKAFRVLDSLINCNAYEIKSSVSTYGCVVISHKKSHTFGHAVNSYKGCINVIMPEIS